MTEEAPSKSAASAAGSAVPNDFRLFAPSGEELAHLVSPEGFCSGLRQLLEACSNPQEFQALCGANLSEIERLRIVAPTLRTTKGEHYADLLLKLFERRAPGSTAQAEEGGSHGRESTQLPSKIAPGPRIDKNRLALGTERSARDPEHLKTVRKLPCLICGRTPCHAHHVKYAQRPGVSIKVSDEFVVPLCSVHHDELHRSANEKNWWQDHKIEPLSVAASLWQGQR